MRLHSLSTRLLALALLGLGCAAQKLTDVPSRENFYRRGSMSATVIGNYVYIDGGELSQAVDGKSPDQQNYPSNSVNSTISIDISKSWTTSNVVLRAIERPWYSKANQAIWTDHQEGNFYVWGGKWIRGRNMTQNALWKFIPDGSGGGTWVVEEAANADGFKQLHQAEHTVFTNTNDTGFVIGGIATGWTEYNRASNQALPGIVTFNMRTKIWQNETIESSSFNTLSKGRAEYIPNFGPKGLVIVLGGSAHRVDGPVDEATARPFDFHNLTFFDPETKTQYWQLATGTIPPSPRTGFCTAAFRSPEGGYEILLFGGANERDKFTYDDAYILSLPGFFWTKVPTSPAGKRKLFSCVPVGKRQVLSIGGTLDEWLDRDPAPQGLLLFDMTDLKWKDSYDASAAVYERAAGIKAWYSNGSFDAVQWSSDPVKQLFSVKSTDTKDSPASPSQSGNPPSNTSESNSPNNTSESKSTRVGAIAGGVVGGVAVIAILAGVAWWLIRRRNRNSGSSPVPGNDDAGKYYYSSENYKTTESTTPPQEFKNIGPMELSSVRDHAELGVATPTYVSPAYTNPLLGHYTAPVEMDVLPLR